MNIALADSYIAGWDSKFYYDFWRPITAIRAGATDGNPATEPDPTWEPLMITPPIQDYPSTHSVLGDAAAEVLGSILGDETAFATTSSTATHPNVEVRSFSSFTQAVDENGDSSPSQRRYVFSFGFRESGFQTVVARASRPCVGCTIRTGGTPVPLI